MPLTGDIHTFSLSAIGRLLNQEKKTGILKVSSHERETSIYFRGGDIVFISGDLAAELSLGALLKDKQLVSDRQIEASLDIAREEKKRLGIVLVEKGLVSQKNLVQVLNYQFKEALSVVLTWQEGSFVYEDGLDGFVEDIRLKLDPIRLVAEAEKWKAYRSLIPNDHVVFQIKEGALQSESFSTDGALRVMLLIDGKRDVSQIMAETGLPRLGVYRALAALAEQEAIELSTATQTSQTGGFTDLSTVVDYYPHAIHEIAADLSLELGKRKADSILTRSLERIFDNRKIAEIMVSVSNPDECTRIIYDHLHSRSSALDVRKLDLDFKKAVLLLLQEEYQVLGFKAAKDTISKLVDSVEGMKGAGKETAAQMLQVYGSLAHDETYLKGEKRFSETLGLPEKNAISHDVPKPSMERIGGAAIIALYSRLIQIIMRELEVEIGSKADTTFRSIVVGSDYYDKFLCQYRVNDDVQTNVNRIRDHISKEGYRLGKSSFISGFQETLIELLLAKKQLLGNKPVQDTVRTIENFLSAINQEEFRPFALNLMKIIKRVI